MSFLDVLNVLGNVFEQHIPWHTEAEKLKALAAVEGAKAAQLLHDAEHLATESVAAVAAVVQDVVNPPAPVVPPAPVEPPPPVEPPAPATPTQDELLAFWQAAHATPTQDELLPMVNGF